MGGGNAGVVCQRCLQQGHWTYECKNAPVYQKRPTRTQQLMQPKVSVTLIVQMWPRTLGLRSACSSVLCPASLMAFCGVEETAS